MDFFEHQDDARRKTSALLVYFFLAVALIVCGVYSVTAGILFLGGEYAAKGKGTNQILDSFWDTELFIWTAGATLLIIFSGAIFRIWQLRAGGESVAQMLGARLVPTDTYDNDERRLLNVVEEMAIASGIPVPPVYMLEDEPGINAFAAGFSLDNAVIGVTQGCVSRLSRDELQGVIAHEFSHILNGDMRLNIKLAGFLNGILLIALIGYGIFRVAVESSTRRRHYRRGRSRGEGGLFVIMVFGGLLMAVGYIGVFFAKLIQSAVSRQREFLADASAVQFTRNPDGISGALKKIGGLVAGSKVHAANAKAVSHMFFGNALTKSWFGFMATHPPLEERIQRIDPSFEGEFDESGAVVERDPSSSGFVGGGVGAPTVESIKKTVDILNTLPAAVQTAKRDPAGALALIYGLLVDSRDRETRETQIAMLASEAPDGIAAEVTRLLPDIDKLSPEARLPLLDAVMPALQVMSEPQAKMVLSTVRNLIEADNEITLFEYAAHKLVEKRLSAKFSGGGDSKLGGFCFSELKDECEIALSALARFGADDENEARRVYALGAAKLSGSIGARGLLPVDNCGLREFDQALNKLTLAIPNVKRKFLDAAASCVLADRQVTIEESQLLRVTFAMLDCPLPR